MQLRSRRTPAAAVIRAGRCPRPSLVGEPHARAPASHARRAPTAAA